MSFVGRLLEEEWLRTKMIRSELNLDEFIIMPNHIHGIVVIKTPSTHLEVGAHGHAPLHSQGGMLYRQPYTLGSFVARFKGSVTRRVRKKLREPTFKVWQRNYYDHIVRGEEELNGIRRYIAENPLRWSKDRYYRS